MAEKEVRTWTVAIVPRKKTGGEDHTAFWNGTSGGWTIYEKYITFLTKKQAETIAKTKKSYNPDYYRPARAVTREEAIGLLISNPPDLGY